MTNILIVCMGNVCRSPAAKIILKLLDQKGIINVGGETMSPFEFAQKNNPNIKKITLDDLLNDVNSNIEKKELRIIIKADVQGSIEAISQSLNGIDSKKVDLKILSTDVGNVTVNDVMLASASNAIILG